MIATLLIILTWTLGLLAIALIIAVAVVVPHLIGRAMGEKESPWGTGAGVIFMLAILSPLALILGRAILARLQ